VLRQCKFQACQLLMVLMHLMIHAGVEQVEAISSALFGLVHGLVGVPQQGVGVAGVHRKMVTPMLAEIFTVSCPIWNGRAISSRMRLSNVSTSSIVRISLSSSTNSSPPGAKPCHHAYDIDQAARDLDQQLVTKLMAMLVVDRFKAIQIHETHQQQLLLSLCMCDSLPDTV